MVKKFKIRKYVLVTMLSLGIILYGFIKVSSTLPTFIKNKSNFKVYFLKRPFDLTFETKNYIIYLNQKSINNIQKGIHGTFDNIAQWAESKLSDGIDAIESKGGEVFKRLKDIDISP